ncbi:hypothetical protein M405DRAFT_187478 [Rhizopogon salebrosus TDB-379]|nr:hypothetical protein M405DRAFT_187478 [Rhizopogon salebrosus TDB-379]
MGIYRFNLPLYSYKGFQGVLDGCGILSARTRYRAYMSLAANVFGSNRTPTVLQAVKCAVEYSKRCEALERSISRRGEMHGSPNQHDDNISQYSRELRPSMVDAGIRMDEDEFTTPDDVNGTGENEVNHDVSMEPMLSEEPSDVEAGDNSRQVVPVTPIRPLNRNGSNRQIGLPTPESLPRRNVVVTPSPASASDIIPLGNDDGSHSDNHNPQTPGSHSGYIAFGVGAAFGFVQGIFQGFRWSSDILLPEISSLYTQVINLQTSLAAAEQALHDANMTTAQSQERCLGMLQDLRNARSRIASLEVRAKDDADEKCDLQQEIANLKGEVLRLQNGIEQVTQIMGSLLPARAVV